MSSRHKHVKYICVSILKELVYRKKVSSPMSILLISGGCLQHSLKKIPKLHLSSAAKGLQSTNNVNHKLKMGER